MGFILNWLVWRRTAKKQQDNLDKVVEELGENKVIAELAERDPKLRESLRTLGVKTRPKI